MRTEHLMHGNTHSARVLLQVGLLNQMKIRRQLQSLKNMNDADPGALGSSWRGTMGRAEMSLRGLVSPARVSSKPVEAPWALHLHPENCSAAITPRISTLIKIMEHTVLMLGRLNNRAPRYQPKASISRTESYAAPRTPFFPSKRALLSLLALDLAEDWTNVGGQPPTCWDFACFSPMFSLPRR